MIHHISISVKNPQHVAEVLAEVLNGQAFPFFLTQAAIWFFHLTNMEQELKFTH